MAEQLGIRGKVGDPTVVDVENTAMVEVAV